MIEYDKLLKYWEHKLREGLSIEILGKTEGDYIGFFQAKDTNRLVGELMDGWVQMHQIEPRENTLTDTIASFLGIKNQPDIADLLRRRFVTYTEFKDLFNQSRGSQLENLLKASAKVVEREKNARYEQTKKANVDSKEGIEKIINYFLIGSRGMNTIVYDKDLEKAYQDFYSLYPVYGLFNIKGEADRQKTALLFQKDDGYFYAMDSANKTLADFFFALRRFRIPDKARRKHTYIVGSSGSGKSELIKSLADVDIMKKKASVIIIDPNRDLAQEIAMFKEHRDNPEDLIFIQPNLCEKEGSDHVPIINPFDIDVTNFGENEIEKAAGAVFEVFNSIAKESGEGNTGYTPNMKTMLMYGIRLMFEKKDGDLWDLIRLMEDETNADLVEMGKNSKYDAVKLFYKARFDLKKYKSARDGMGSRLDFITSMGVGRYLCGKTSINIEEAMNKKKTIIFNLAKGDLGAPKSFVYGQFVVAYIISIGFKRASIEPEFRVPCHLYIDEFHNYASKKLLEAFEEGRKFKLYLTVATQTDGQGLTREATKRIMGNTHVKIIGSSARATRSAMSKEMDLSNKDVAEITGVNEKSLKDLKQGEFIVQVGNNGLPFKMINRRRTLGSKNAMSKEEWKKILTRQKSLYYVKKQTLTDEKIFGKDNIPSDTKNNVEGKKKRGNKDKGGFNSKYDF